MPKAPPPTSMTYDPDGVIETFSNEQLRRIQAPPTAKAFVLCGKNTQHSGALQQHSPAVATNTHGCTASRATRAFPASPVRATTTTTSAPVQSIAHDLLADLPEDAFFCDDLELNLHSDGDNNDNNHQQQQQQQQQQQSEPVKTSTTNRLGGGLAFVCPTVPSSNTSPKSTKKSPSTTATTTATTTTCKKKQRNGFGFHERTLAVFDMPLTPPHDAPKQLDVTSAATWQYPRGVDRPVRAYQQDICEQALKQNCLVCLPTGLGKTLIASVVMYNFVRWFPDGIVVFVVPNNSIVAQQKTACTLDLPFAMVCYCMRVAVRHTHTHTHTERERERERDACT
jgi:hypothetical protein